MLMKMTTMDTRLALINGVMNMNAVAWDTRASKEQKCASCQCVLSNFTGKYIMAKGHGRKLVCGICAAQLEIKGWKEIARAK